MLFRDRRAGFDAPARMAWIERHQPARFAKIAHVVGAQGLPQLSPHRRDAARRRRRAWQHVGNVQSVARLGRGARVRGRDGHVGVGHRRGRRRAGPGLRRRGHDRSGRPRDLHDPSSATGLRSLPWTEHTHQIGGPTQAGADCARWCHDTFRVRGTLGDAIARTGAALREDAPVFLPYLAGERAPVWSSGVRGAFHRIDRAHAPDDFLWSVMEGVAHAVADILVSRKRAPGIRAHEVRACGGGAQSDAWCALKADVLGIPVIRSRAAETGLVGAAMAAAVGLGWIRTCGARRCAWPSPGRRFMPHARVFAKPTRSCRHLRCHQAIRARARRRHVKQHILATYGTAHRGARALCVLLRGRGQLRQSHESAQRRQAGELPCDPRDRILHRLHGRRARPLVRRRLQPVRGGRGRARL